ncbi:hypothetical protein [Paraflavitalea speifideaquila]|uniref:hypothetical protein n=1 Tax=Paraflavitalea speifideaquila TaxID=3076558 RepID=UPI0028E2D08E|nr:hypothetical protein [Paraflavitalea speifideiaquila]
MIISKCTHQFSWVQFVHLGIASLTVFLVLFYSPLPLVARLLIPFGYYFSFEFSVLARNYAIGVLAAFCICLIMRRSFRFKTACYYGFLLVLSNGHLFALILAGSFHLYFLMSDYEKYASVKRLAGHALLGALFYFLLFILFFRLPRAPSMYISGWDAGIFPMS